MNIGILTFHEADSYGAVLQAYALQQALKTMGAQSQFVQIRTPEKPAGQAPAPGVASVFARRLQAEGEKRKALFETFRREHMAVSRPYQPEEDIDADFDSFVAGSDQIWNFRIPGADARYFLPFAQPHKRNAYAASFGAEDLPEHVKPWVAGQLSQFRSISLREESGCGIVKELTDRDTPVCLDPTLLLSREEWSKLLSAEEETEDYLLLFLLKYDEDLITAAREAAKEQNLPLRTVTAAFMPQLGMASWNGTGVREWLTAIAKARCVYTNSFHGIVFSLIFGRPFRAALLTGELSTRNGRVRELLNFLGLSEALSHPILPDRNDVEARLQPRRDASLAFLRNIVHDCE